MPRRLKALSQKLIYASRALPRVGLCPEKSFQSGSAQAADGLCPAIMAASALQVTNPDVPATIRELHLRTCHVEDTSGDGACAIHAAFGEKQHGRFKKSGARQFLRDKFGPTADVFSARVGDETLLSELRVVLWQELLQPCAASAAKIHSSRFVVRPEGSMIWNRVQRGSPDLAMRCMNAVRSEHDAYVKFMEVRHHIVEEFSQLCIRPLEQSFVRPLLTHLDMLHEYECTPIEIPGSIAGVT